MVMSLRQVTAKVKGRRCLFDVKFEQTLETRFGPVTRQPTMKAVDRKYVLSMAADPRYKILKVIPLKTTQEKELRAVASWRALGGKLD